MEKEFLGRVDEPVLKLIVVMIVQLCKYIKNTHTC